MGSVFIKSDLDFWKYLSLIAKKCAWLGVVIENWKRRSEVKSCYQKFKFDQEKALCDGKKVGDRDPWKCHRTIKNNLDRYKRSRRKKSPDLEKCHLGNKSWVGESEKVTVIKKKSPWPSKNNQFQSKRVPPQLLKGRVNKKSKHQLFTTPPLNLSSRSRI